MKKSPVEEGAVPPAPKDYEVGFARPPKRTRFTPGRSGNPKGRPKGSQNLTTVVAKLAREPMTVKEGGRPRRMSRFAALQLTIWAAAYKGNAKAWAQIHQSVRDAGLLRGEPENISSPITADDEAIVGDFLKKLGAKLPKAAISHTQKGTRKKQVDTPEESNP
jgi:hypothetical protein